MKKYDLVFVTTFINDSYIYELMRSIFECNFNISLKIIVISQNCDVKLNELFVSNEFNDLEIININRQVSLSFARNVGIRHLIENNIAFDYIMFPDDDSTFDINFFVKFKDTIKSNSVIDVYCTNTFELYKKNKYRHGQFLRYENYDAAMSVNMIVDHKTMINVGFFDENMGVGTFYGAGEDADFFIRCCDIKTNGFIYKKELWNYHPKATDKYKKMSYKQLIKQYRSYGRGAMYLFNKHKMYYQSINYIFKALFGAIIAFISFNYKLSLARFYAMFVRLYTFIYLYFRVYEYKK